MEQFEPNDLLLFASVADAGGFSRAAERIGLPKSTLSRRIALPDDALLAARRLAIFPIGLYAAPAYLNERGIPLTPDELHRHAILRLLGRDGMPTGWTLSDGSARWEGAPTGAGSGAA